MMFKYMLILLAVLAVCLRWHQWLPPGPQWIT